MRLFIDESLSPQIALHLNATGRHDAAHPLHVGRRGASDDQVLAWCIAEDRVIVTQNARDFRRLARRVELHPGLIILPSTGRDQSWDLLQAALAFLERRGEPMDLMVNHLLALDVSGEITFAALPERSG